MNIKIKATNHSQPSSGGLTSPMSPEFLFSQKHQVIRVLLSLRFGPRPCLSGSALRRRREFCVFC